MDVRVLKEREISVLRPHLGDELFSSLGRRRHACAALPDGGLFVMVRAPETGKPVHIFLGDALLLMVTDDQRSGHLVRELKSATPLEALHDFLEALTGDDAEKLERIEDTVTELEDELLTSKRPVKGIGSRIVALRRKLLSMKRHYEQFALVAGELADDLAGALPPEQFRRFQALRRHAEWLLAFVLHLRDYVTQVREAYQAQIDIEQNQIMKIFTVLTAVFLPLSLIVGWYGMNFEMPEYRWELGYAFVILLSAAVCVFCIWFFRRKRWF